MSDKIIKVTCSHCKGEKKVRESVYLKRLTKMDQPDQEKLDASYACRDCRREHGVDRYSVPVVDPKAEAAKKALEMKEAEQADENAAPEND